MPSAIEIVGVRQSFRTGFWMKRVEVLRGITFDVPAGSVFGLLGPNGAGKTTLIHLITGIRRPGEGRVLVGGAPAESLEARDRIGYLPERPYFHEHLTGESFLRYMGTLAGVTGSELRRRSDEVLSVVGLSDVRHTELGRYSKGMLQRLGFAQAILRNPGVLVLDEPMSGLDPVGRREIRELIGRLAGEGRTIFFSSHIVADIESACDRVAMLTGGSLIRTGTVSEMLERSEGAIEIEVSGATEALVERLEREFGPGRTLPLGLRYSVQAQEQVSRLLRLVLDSGGAVRSVRPVRPSLEDIFFAEARK